MRLVRIPDPRLFSQTKTYLDADYVNGTALTVLNNIGFLQNDWAVIGEVGEKTSEPQNVQSLTGVTQINVQIQYNFFHNKGTTVYKSVWNQVAIEGMPPNGNWSVLNDNGSGAGVIDWSQPETLFYHPLGDDTWSYRFRFRNSLTNSYSEYSPTVAGSGFTAFQLGQIIINIRKKIRDPNRNRFQDPELALVAQQIQRDIEMIMPKLFFLRVDTFEATTQVAIPTVGGIYKYALSQFTDFNYLSKVRYQYFNGINNIIFDLKPMSDLEYDRLTANQNRPKDDNVRKMRMIAGDSFSPNGYFEVFPTPLGALQGNFYCVYYRKLHTLAGIADVTELPFPEIIEDGAAWRLHLMMGNKDQADIYERLYLGPDPQDKKKPLSGLALLDKYNSSRQKLLGFGKKLFEYRGPRGRYNFFGAGIYTRDYIKEFYMD